jgi:16S rRNA G966 N2-methylase RsmD
MDGRRADMVFTDPPYNVKIVGHATGLEAIQHKNFKMASGATAVKARCPIVSY